MLIVRSSTPDEDGLAHSAAGVYESRFCGRSANEIERALRQVNEGMNSSKAIKYRAQRGMSSTSIASWSVLVQLVVPAIAAGVTLASDVDGAKRRISQASLGLSNMLLGGQIPGDVFDSQRDDFCEPVDKTLAMFPWSMFEESSPSLGEWAEVPCMTEHGQTMLRGKVVHIDDEQHLFLVRHRNRLEPVLPRRVVRELEHIAEQFTDNFPLGVDIEWAIDEHEVINIVQVRSMTAPVPDAQNRNTREYESGTDRLTTGQPGAPGRATGPLFNPCEWRKVEDEQTNPVLYCGAASPDVIDLMLDSAGIISSDMGILSHVAILARELGKPCVIGVDSLEGVAQSGEMVTVDGTVGSVQRAPHSDAHVDATQSSYGDALSKLAAYGSRIVVEYGSLIPARTDGTSLVLRSGDESAFDRRQAACPYAGDEPLVLLQAPTRQVDVAEHSKQAARPVIGLQSRNLDPVTLNELWELLSSLAADAGLVVRLDD